MAYTQDQYEGAGQWIAENLGNPELVAQEIQRLGLTQEDVLKAVQTQNAGFTQDDVARWMVDQGLDPWSQAAADTVDTGGAGDEASAAVSSGGYSGEGLPSSRELLEASGYKIDYSTPEAAARTQAISDRVGAALYGNIGANYDARDWAAIMASANPLEAAEAALARMYSDPAYQQQNTQFLVSQGYDPGQAYLTYRQMNDRVGANYTPTASQQAAIDNYYAKNTVALPIGKTVDFAHPLDGREWVLTTQGWSPAADAAATGAEVLYRSNTAGEVFNNQGQLVYTPQKVGDPGTFGDGGPMVGLWQQQRGIEPAGGAAAKTTTAAATDRFTPEQYRVAGQTIQQYLDRPDILTFEIDKLGLTPEEVTKAVQTVRPGATQVEVQNWFTGQSVDPWAADRFTQPQYDYAGDVIEKYLGLNRPDILASEASKLGLTKGEVLKAAQTYDPNYTMGQLDKWYAGPPDGMGAGYTGTTGTTGGMGGVGTTGGVGGTGGGGSAARPPAAVTPSPGGVGGVGTVPPSTVVPGGLGGVGTVPPVNLGYNPTAGTVAPPTTIAPRFMPSAYTPLATSVAAPATQSQSFMDLLALYGLKPSGG